MTYKTYAKGRCYKVWRDQTTHCGHIEQLSTGLTTAEFVCMEGAEDLLALKRERRHSGPIGLDHECKKHFAAGSTVYHPEHGYGHLVADANECLTYKKGE